MRLDRYFLGVRLRLHSPLPPELLAEHINRAASSSFNPFADGVVGGVRFRRMRLGFQGGIFEYNAKPILSGSVRAISSGTELRLEYGAPTWARVFFAVWYVVLGAIAVSTAADPMLMIFLVAPIVLTVLGTLDADDRLESLLMFLFDEAQASSQMDKAVST
jgi:hypothetical protein